MELDELRVDWLKRYDSVCETFDIRRLEDFEIENFSNTVPYLNTTEVSLQQLNWFLYLEGVPPYPRGAYVAWDEFRKIELGIFKFYDSNYKLKEDYWYLEELYKIIREES